LLRIDSPFSDVALHSVQELDPALMPCPPNGSCTKALPTQSVAVSLLLLEAILLVLNRPSRLAFSVSGALPFCLIRPTNQVDDEPIQKIFDPP
jgi:hypothetical protein